MTTKIVPVEPTEEMIRAACLNQCTEKFASYEDWWNSHTSGISAKIRRYITEDYQAMLAAAPTAQAEPGSKPLRPNCYWKPDDTESPYDCCDDLDIINDLFYDGAKVGDEYELNEAHYFPAKFRIVKIPDDTNDDYEVERISGKDLYTHAPDNAAALSAKEETIAEITQFNKCTAKELDEFGEKIEQQAEIARLQEMLKEMHANEVSDLTKSIAKNATIAQQAEENSRLLQANRDCVDHFDALKDDFDKQAKKLSVSATAIEELCKAAARQAARIRELEESLNSHAPEGHNFTNGQYIALRQQLATANASLASKDALLEQARKALAAMVLEAKARYCGLRIADEALAAIERHMEGEK